MWTSLPLFSRLSPANNPRTLEAEVTYEELKQRAATLRRFAQEEDNQALKEELEEIAQQYDKIAERYKPPE